MNFRLSAAAAPAGPAVDAELPAAAAQPARVVPPARLPLLHGAQRPTQRELDGGGAARRGVRAGLRVHGRPGARRRAHRGAGGSTGAIPGTEAGNSNLKFEVPKYHLQSGSLVH